MSLTSELQENTWRRQAACRDMDTNIFYPARGASDRAAREVCGRCPVRFECRAEAVRNYEFGVWGDTSGRERRRIRRHLRVLSEQEERLSA